MECHCFCTIINHCVFECMCVWVLIMCSWACLMCVEEYQSSLVLGSGCYLNSSVLYSTNGEGSDPPVQSVSLMTRNPFIPLCSPVPDSQRASEQRGPIWSWLEGWLVMSVLRGLFIARCAFSSWSLNHVTSFVLADLAGLLLAKYHRGLTSACAPDTEQAGLFLCSCALVLWSVHAHGFVLPPGVEGCFLHF